jgi:hypothetical protein
VFLTAWSLQASEKEKIRINGAIVSNVLNAVGPNLKGGHAWLQLERSSDSHDHRFRRRQCGKYGRNAGRVRKHTGQPFVFYGSQAQ